jgi:streptogramin lyase
MNSFGSLRIPRRHRYPRWALAAAGAFLLVPLSALSQAPTVSRLVPGFGSIAGNNIVIVSGTGFAAGATVSFGGVPATSVAVVNSTSLTAKPPAHSAGSVTVSVTNPDSQVGSLANGYKYLAASGQTSFQYFPIPVSDVAVTDISAGPDGNLWFLTNGGESLNPDGLAKMTPSGTFTNYPLADPGLLRDIAPGPDGNVWYVRKSPDKIGRVTPSGVATEFLNVSNRFFEGIAAGPDGAMWVTENFVNLVGRITTTGAFTEFIVNNQAYGITLGPDGNLWLAGCYSNSPVCTRVLPGGQYLNFPIPNPVSGLCPQKIVTGPDGNLWFQYANGLKVGRLTTGGAYTEFQVPPVSSRMTSPPVWMVTCGSRTATLWMRGSAASRRSARSQSFRFRPGAFLGASWPVPMGQFGSPMVSTSVGSIPARRRLHLSSASHLAACSIRATPSARWEARLLPAERGEPSRSPTSAAFQRRQRQFRETSP